MIFKIDKTKNFIKKNTKYASFIIKIIYLFSNINGFIYIFFELLKLQKKNTFFQ